jgi:hypothetical protein
MKLEGRGGYQRGDAREERGMAYGHARGSLVLLCCRSECSVGCERGEAAQECFPHLWSFSLTLSSSLNSSERAQTEQRGCQHHPLLPPRTPLPNLPSSLTSAPPPQPQFLHSPSPQTRQTLSLTRMDSDPHLISPDPPANSPSTQPVLPPPIPPVNEPSPPPPSLRDKHPEGHHSGPLRARATSGSTRRMRRAEEEGL